MNRTLSILLAPILLALLLSCVDYYPLGKVITIGSVQLDVVSAETQYLEVEGPSHGGFSEKPWFVAKIKLTNLGGSDIRYAPGQAIVLAKERELPFLYDEEDRAYAGITLSKAGRVVGQVSEPVTVGPKGEVEDRMIFEVPPAKVKSLRLVIPAKLFGEEGLVGIRMPYTYRDPQEIERPFMAFGAPVERGSVVFNVLGYKPAFLRLNDPALGPGTASRPVLMVKYTIANKGQGVVRYDPKRLGAGGSYGPFCTDELGNTIVQVNFGPNIAIPDQQAKAVDIPPGKSVEDLTLFDLPPRNVKALFLEVPMSLFGQEGIFRVKIPYEYKEPEKPKPPEPKPEETEEQG